MAQLQFKLVAFPVDDAQIPQVHGGVAVQDLQNEPRLHVGVESTDRSLHEGMQHGRVLHADGDDRRLRDDDRQRDGLVPVASAAFLHGRDVDDDHRVVVLDVDARAFLVIQRRAQVGQIDAGFHGHVGEFHIGWFRKAQPGSVLGFLDLLHLAVNRSEHSQHVSHPPFAFFLRCAAARIATVRAHNLLKDSPTFRISAAHGRDFIERSYCGVTAMASPASSGAPRSPRMQTRAAAPSPIGLRHRPTSWSARMARTRMRPIGRTASGSPLRCVPIPERVAKIIGRSASIWACSDRAAPAGRFPNPQARRSPALG